MERWRDRETERQRDGEAMSSLRPSVSLSLRPSVPPSLRLSVPPSLRLKSYGNRIPKFDPTRAPAICTPPGISRLFGRGLALRGDQRDLHSAACGVHPPARRRGQVPADDVNDSAVVRDAQRPATAGAICALHQQSL